MTAQESRQSRARELWLGYLRRRAATREVRPAEIAECARRQLARLRAFVTLCVVLAIREARVSAALSTVDS